MYMGLSKTFDTVNHDTVFSKTKSLLKNTKQEVTINKKQVPLK